MDEVTSAIRDVFDLVSNQGAWSRHFGGWRSLIFLRWVCGAGATMPLSVMLLWLTLALLPVHIDPETDRHAWTATLRLAERHRLTLYDATYLELAKPRDLPLARVDIDLRAAASVENIRLLGV